MRLEVKSTSYANTKFNFWVCVVGCDTGGEKVRCSGANEMILSIII